MTTLQISDSDMISQSSSAAMSYTPFMLSLLGLLGILLHNLIQLNRINKAKNGDSNIWDYIKYERYSILISILIVIGCVITSQEISQLEQAGKMLGLAFLTIGYMGQSLLIFFMGKAEKTIGKTDSNG